MSEDRTGSPDFSDPQYFLIRQTQMQMWDSEAARALQIEVVII